MRRASWGGQVQDDGDRLAEVNCWTEARARWSETKSASLDTGADSALVRRAGGVQSIREGA